MIYCKLPQAALAALLCLPSLFAQGSGILTVAPPPKLAAKRGAVAQARIPVALAEGYHVNSNTPSESYLIPLRLTWSPGPLEPVEVLYPKPRMEKYSFSKEPISVFSGTFELGTKFRVPVSTAIGPGVLIGKLRYQACNNSACFAPKTVEVRLPYQIE